ncbi:unnamed protein product [Phytomonas sp. EM1]|nr:unnamed protein product [Phytomonas sp. EM1]|eukprot:CCW63551.1 unnamed protein product [Phytomonas sp. isolate EM1]
MMSLDCKIRSPCINEANQEVLEMISKNVDTILALCSADSELRNYALKFQLEQAADKAVFDSGGETVSKIEHMKKVLRRMVDLALAVAMHILERTKNDKGNMSIELDTVSQPSTDLLQSSSVEDFTEGSCAWLEIGAHLSYVSTDLLSLVLVSHSNLRHSLQMYMLGKGVLNYISDALNITQEHEITYFQEGYKTEHVRLMANLCFDNVDCSKAIVGDDNILIKILSATRIDEENPGMVEWAEFAIRNLCASTYEAQEKLKQLKPVRLTDDSKQLLNGRATHSFNNAGKLHIELTKN